MWEEEKDGKRRCQCPGHKEWWKMDEKDNNRDDWHEGHMWFMREVRGGCVDRCPPGEVRVELD